MSNTIKITGNSVVNKLAAYRTLLAGMGETAIHRHQKPHLAITLSHFIHIIKQYTSIVLEIILKIIYLDWDGPVRKGSMHDHEHCIVFLKDFGKFHLNHYDRRPPKPKWIKFVSKFTLHVFGFCQSFAA